MQGYSKVSPDVPGDKGTVSRRQFLVGSSAAAVAIALPAVRAPVILTESPPCLGFSRPMGSGRLVGVLDHPMCRCVIVGIGDGT